MALIDVVTWTPDGGEFIFAYKYPESNLSTYTQLVVYESQEALLFQRRIDGTIRTRKTST